MERLVSSEFVKGLNTEKDRMIHTELTFPKLANRVVTLNGQDVSYYALCDYCLEKYGDYFDDIWFV